MNNNKELETQSFMVQKQVAENRLLVIASSLKSLYIDKCEGKLPETVFLNLMHGFTKEQAELEKPCRRSIPNWLIYKISPMKYLNEWF